MATVSTIDPVTRLEGHLKIEVTIDTVNGVQQVTNAKATGTMFRGFENILVGRHPWDAQHITQRVCGVCPVSHGLAAVLAQDAMAGVTVPANGRLVRNLVLGANYIQSHILHFYHLAALDFVEGPNMPPWQPSWKTDKRLNAATTTAVVNNYVKALAMRRQAHELGAIFGGKLPHLATFIQGGATTNITTANIAQAKAYLATLIPFIQNTYIPDVNTLFSVYSDYAKIGVGTKNLLSYGVFDQATAGTKLLARGFVTNGATAIQTLDTTKITEAVTYSWYADTTNNLSPAAGVTTPQNPKGNAYSWLKAPRLSNLPMEAGPLARMWVNGDYRTGISVADRHKARAAEALKVATAMQTWLGQLTVGTSEVKSNPVANGTGIGLTEAPRGAIGHWVQVASGKISRYQIITPTCWNASPRDGAGVLGPIEKALIGTPVTNVAEPIEVVRVIHSFDPCLSCAVHVMRPSEKANIFTLGHTHGDEDTCSVPDHDHDHDHDHGHDHEH